MKPSASSNSSKSESSTFLNFNFRKGENLHGTMSDVRLDLRKKKSNDT